MISGAKHMVQIVRPERTVSDADALGQVVETERMLGNVLAEVWQEWSGRDDQNIRAEIDETRTDYRLELRPMTQPLRPRDRVKYTDAGEAITLHVTRVYMGRVYWTLFCERVGVPT